jgi:hypothetical protein
LHGGDLSGDVAGRFRGLCRERLHFTSDDGKALAGLARARYLDGSVEGKKVGLSGDFPDQLNDLADPLCNARQLADDCICFCSGNRGAALF